MQRIFSFFLLGGMLLAFSLSSGQEPTAPTSPTSSTPASPKEKESPATQPAETDTQRRARLALEVLQLTGGLRPIDSSIEAWVARYQALYPTMPQDIWRQTREKLNIEMTQMTAGAWAQHYTEEELNAFLAFYKSPAGQALARKRGSVIKDVVRDGEEIGAQMDRTLRSIAVKQGIEPSKAQTKQPGQSGQPGEQAAGIIERPGSLPMSEPQSPPRNILENHPQTSPSPLPSSDTPSPSTSVKKTAHSATAPR